MGIYNIVNDSRNCHADLRFDSFIVGRGVGHEPSPADRVYQEHLKALEEVRLTGYRFLKPPGISKTLKIMHEEQKFSEDIMSMTAASSVELQSFGDLSVSMGSTHPSDLVRRRLVVSGTDRSATFEADRLENIHLDDDNNNDNDNAEDSFNFSPNRTLPTMNASLPSLYLPPPSEN